MKTTPTAFDIEAATLFTPAPGTLALFRIGIDAPGRWLRMAEDMVDSGLYSHPMALDTDDPATVGCMLAQVDESGRRAGHLSRFDESADSPWQSFDVLFSDETGETVIDNGSCHTFRVVGTSRGAALVAAMRAFAGAAK